MSNERLLDRQNLLLKHLTSPQLIFGQKPGHALYDEIFLEDTHYGRLRLEAELTYGKRISKISKAFPKTLELLGKRQTKLFKEFASNHPPTSYRRYVEARQFYDFLLPKFRSLRPQYLRDVATLEIAIAKMNAVGRMLPADQNVDSTARTDVRLPAIRKSADIEVLSLKFDIRCFFEKGFSNRRPVRKTLYLIVFQSRDGSGTRVLEVTENVRSFLDNIDEWTSIESYQSGNGHPISKEMRELLSLGLVETLE